MADGPSGSLVSGSTQTSSTPTSRQPIDVSGLMEHAQILIAELQNVDVSIDRVLGVDGFGESYMYVIPHHLCGSGDFVVKNKSNIFGIL